MLTFIESLFADLPHRRISPKPQQRKSEYHGVATAVGKISKRLHSIEEALKSTVDTTPDKAPIPDLSEDEIPTKPITPLVPTVPVPATVPVPVIVPDKPEEGKKVA